ncbi:MAG: histone deacetylase [Geminicoccaceae bacterium]
MRCPVVHHPAYVSPLPTGHRFPMPKFGRLYTHLLESGLVEPGQVVQPQPVPRAWLELAHTPAYVAAILEQRLGEEDQRRLGLPLSPELVLRSRCAVAGTVLAARLALEHGVACNTAGGSHHAFAGFGSGFCVFNDVAVAARVLLTKGIVRQVLVIDLDVHQGDGTAAIFATDPAVVTLSVHCRTNFPARKQQSDLDVSLDPGTGDTAYLGVLDAVLPDLLRRVRPDLVFYNAGVDTHAEDRLGRLAMTNDGIARRERLVLDLCQRAGIPVACVVGGGYAHDIEVLVRRHALLHVAILDLLPP